MCGLLQPEATRWHYLEGASRPELLSPDAWTLDQHFLDLPGAIGIQTETFMPFRNRFFRIAMKNPIVFALLELNP